ncbi:tyrosine recombinase [Alphaproteobacteria bacterium LSUCC0684]
MPRSTGQIDSGDTRAIARFLDAISAERGAASNTIESYERDLRLTAASLAGTATLLTVDAEGLRHCLAGWSGVLKASSLSRRLSTLRQFMQFCVEEGLRPDDPSRLIDSPKTPKPLPKSLSEEDVVRLLNAASLRDGAEGARLVAMLEILYATGMRVSELVTLPMGAISRRRRTLAVTGKGGRERLVVLTDAALDAIEAWTGWRDQDPQAVVSPFLFPDGRDGHLSRQWFALALDTLRRDAGIARRVSPHMLRHSFATHMLNRGADLRSLQILLGHADITTTEIYTRTRDERLAGLVRDTHPLARNRSSGL